MKKPITRQIVKSICCGDTQCSSCQHLQNVSYRMRCSEFGGFMDRDRDTEAWEYKRCRDCLTAEKLAEALRKREMGDAVTDYKNLSDREIDGLEGNGESEMIVIVPNVISDAINKKLDAAIAACPDAEKDREILYAELLDHYFKYGVVPDFRLEKKVK